MPRSVVFWAALLFGCHSSKTGSATADAAPRTVVPPSSAASPAARFSRPIAAARSTAGDTLVAGLVVADAAIAVTALAPDGTTRWTRPLITGVAWGANSALSVLTSGDRAVVVWRGAREGQQVTVAATIMADGTAASDPFPVGPAACTTSSDLAWIEHGTKGTWVVKTRALSGRVAKPALTLPEDREPALLCTPHAVLAFGDGDDDVTLSTTADAVAARPVRVIQDAEFRGDDERGHEVYAVSDVVGLVRIGLSGSVATREVRERHPGPWRRFGRKLGEADDLTLVDADATQALLAFTHDTGGPEGGGRTSLEGFLWERGGTREESVQLAPPDGTYERGPFWSGAVPVGIVVAWALRGVRADAGQAPVLGLAYRTVSLGALGDLHRIARPADDLVDAGCDDSRCYAVALTRAANEDGGQPEALAVLAYP